MDPKILFCDVAECSYNGEQKCHATAIKVGHPHSSCELSHPMCDTYLLSREKLNMSGKSGVGVCEEDCCSYNEMLKCTASGVSIGFHHTHADCRTFKKR